MIVVIDSNILFSSLISPNGRIASLITLPPGKVDFITCNYAVAEIFKHQPKIVKYAKREPHEVATNLSTLINRFKLYNESLFSSNLWQEAQALTEGVDCFDISFVALTLKENAWLWTGDKPLRNHLEKLGFERVLNTEELYQKLIGER